MDTPMDELGKQLRCPSGAAAQQVGDMMFASNFNMITKTIAHLPLTAGARILEIGFGNGKHVPHLFEQAEGLSYTGIDISDAMVEQARQFNPSPSSVFLKTDGSGHLGFPDQYFDAVFTVNTLYFWPDVSLQLSEIKRVLKGGFAMGFIEANFGKQLPFAQKGFSFYSKEHLTEQLRASGFQQIAYNDYQEKVISKDGQWVERPFSVLIAS